MSGITILILAAGGMLCLLGGIATTPMVALIVFVIVSMFREGAFKDETMTSTIITFVMVGVLVLLAVLFVVFGIRLLRGPRPRRPRRSSHWPWRASSAT